MIWVVLFCTQLALIFFLASYYHIPNNTTGALAQGFWVVAGMGLGVWFLLGQTSRAKQAFEVGERWCMSRGGWLLLAGTGVCAVFQWLSAIGWAQRNI